MAKSILFAAVMAALVIAAPAVAEPLGQGSFVGASGHSTTGSVTVTRQGGQYVVELGGDFVFDGAPDPYVALGSGRKPFAGGLIAELGANQGAQTYTIDAAGLEDAREVIIWCKKYAVPLGVAPIN